VGGNDALEGVADVGVGAGVELYVVVGDVVEAAAAV
jgi:hypothetical protein